MPNIDIDNVIIALTKIALQLEKEIVDNELSDNVISVRNRARATDTLSTVQRVLADDWLIQRLTLQLGWETIDG